MTPSLSIEINMAERDQLVDPYAAWPISPDHIPEIVYIIIAFSTFALKFYHGGMQVSL